MHSTWALVFAASLWTSVVLGQDSTTTTTGSSSILQTCKLIQQAISSSSAVYYPGSSEYAVDIEHFLPSSTQNSTCSVEPGSVQDVATILSILGKNETPFAVKGGGHTSNLGFSSTLGVQVAMKRFNNLTYDTTTTYVHAGAGLLGDDVYNLVLSHGRNWLGPRAPGVGIAGFTLGGGANWLSNQYGETFDSVVAFDLVLPNGTFVKVTQDCQDLYFGLRGGYNNFGIVTGFTYKTYPQGQIWAAQLLFPGSSIEPFNAAVANFFANTTDPKATIVVQYRYFTSQAELSMEITTFYDAPTPPEGIFDEILAIPGSSGTPGTIDYIDVLTYGTPDATGTRFTFGDSPVPKFPVSLLNAIANETQVVGAQATNLSASLIMFMIWQNLPNFLLHGPESAWPADRAAAPQPINSWALWTDASKDAAILGALHASGDRLSAVAESEGQNLSNMSLYPNISPANTPLTKMYGNHLPRLHSIKTQYDPGNVMGLAGGFKF